MLQLSRGCLVLFLHSIKEVTCCLLLRQGAPAVQVAAFSKHAKSRQTAECHGQAKSRGHGDCPFFRKSRFLVNECTWVSVLPLLGCPRAVLFIQQLAAWRTSKAKKQKVKIKCCHKHRQGGGDREGCFSFPLLLVIGLSVGNKASVAETQ